MSTKGKTIGIYFSPADLYAQAEAHGQRRPHALSASATVCEFVRLGLELGDLAAEHRRLGGDPGQALRDAIAGMQEPIVTRA